MYYTCIYNDEYLKELINKIVFLSCFLIHTACIPPAIHENKNHGTSWQRFVQLGLPCIEKKQNFPSTLF